MQLIYQNEDSFYNDFLPLIAELLCGRHYDPANQQHVEWLRRKVGMYYLAGAKAICLYTDENQPVVFLLLEFDKGLEGVGCFGKMAVIAMFGLFPEYRGQGIGLTLLEEAAKYVKENGGECIYVDTYAENTGAIRFYTRCGFIPVAYHPGENGLDDMGQVYLYKELR